MKYDVKYHDFDLLIMSPFFLITLISLDGIDDSNDFKTSRFLDLK